jgi:hypothetical protein
VITRDASPAADKTVISITKSANPPDGTDFRFRTDAGGFMLDHAVPDDGDAFGGRLDFKVQPAVGWRFVELLPAFWRLAGIGQSAGAGTTIETLYDDAGHLIGVLATPVSGDHVVVTFYNLRDPTSFTHLPLLSRN